MVQKSHSQPPFGWCQNHVNHGTAPPSSTGAEFQPSTVETWIQSTPLPVALMSAKLKIHIFGASEILNCTFFVQESWNMTPTPTFVFPSFFWKLSESTMHFWHQVWSPPQINRWHLMILVWITWKVHPQKRIPGSLKFNGEFKVFWWHLYDPCKNGAPDPVLSVRKKITS